VDSTARFFTRFATGDDAADLARLVNAAYEVERFFVAGDRTSADDVRSLMERGIFLLGIEENDVLAGCIHVAISGTKAGFGMLAVSPDRQGHGWGRRLVQAAEAYALAAGCRTMVIRVVNLRTDLFPIYRRLGYAETGAIEPYVHRPMVRPVHFVVMAKTLA
jgi:GNAT superfamily N-acetyltransferase